ncbi:ferredoxin reductase [Rhizobium grahamii]|uniref:Ferredoxin reductase n=1 Tax=Rhizobium grahamii TaxID=1120045 RepID=A0A5Q0C5A3_9HYPH|nr:MULTISPECIES: FAD-dependent oxidoreductase [Rhizobium]QFY60435.1 ferredoxin reductase [Rhizobium grahamii]QRM50437.1 ferredoxin reductase [Rhizobium sp. BG6]
MNAGIVIIGAGECGARAAFVLREYGYEEPITLIGSEAHPPYERPPLSKSQGASAPVVVAPRDKYASERIDLRTSCTVTRIDPDLQLVHFAEGDPIKYDKLLLTTGATPRMLRGISPASKRILPMRTFEHALGIKCLLGPTRRTIIVGGGFIGLEVGAMARAAGTEVVILETQSRVLTRGVPQTIADTLVERHRQEGVRFECGIQIEAVRETDDAVEVELADGRTLTADSLVVGIGVVPNTQLAEAAGLVIDNGIAVNELLETSAANIYAAGDCCSFPSAIYDGRRVRLESWRNTQDQGIHAAKMLLGKPDTLASVPWMWSDQYDLTLQVAGLADGSERSVVRNYEDGSRIIFHLGADGRLLAASGIGVGNSIARDMKLSEMLIAARAEPDPDHLSDPSFKLKSILPR